jgi:RNA polymerase sigma-70 factor (ECF subfamily)
VDLEAELLATYPILVRRLALVLRDASTAEDVAQSAFARALERRSSFRGGSVQAWFFTIGMRLAFNELRRRRFLAFREHPEEPTWAMSTEPDVWIALATVPPKQRAALVLSTLEGYTHAEIGQILGVRPGTVSSWLSRTKGQLRDLMGDDQ